MGSRGDASGITCYFTGSLPGPVPYIQLRRDEAWAGWDDARRRLGNGTPFASARFLDAASHAFGQQPAVFLHGGNSLAEATGMLGIFERRRGPFAVAALPAFTAYTAYVSQGGTSLPPHEHPLNALGTALTARYDHAVLQLPPTVSDVRPLSWQGWSTSTRYTYLLEPGWDDTHMSRGPRSLLRRWQDEIRVTESPELVREAIHLAAGAYGRQGRRFPAALPSVLTLARTLVASGDARVLVASRRNCSEPEAGAVFLCDGTSAAYWIAGSVPGPSMTVLLSRALQMLDLPPAGIDLVGANTPSIAEFKRRLGATLVPFQRCTVTPSRLLNLGRTLGAWS